jgi:[acyl-carrier-protein] S-malonyltransferase
MPTPDQLQARIGTVAFAFRGYNVTNLGRTPELLEHPAYGPAVEAALRQASQMCAEALGRPVDLVTRVRERRDTHGLSSYGEDVALIVAVSMAQLGLLDEFFGLGVEEAKLVFGYSLGEASALIATGVYKMEHLLRAPLTFADDCVALAEDVTMGVLFSRGPELDYTTVERLCLEVSQEGQGVIAISTYLAPNSLLLLGQGRTVDRYKELLHEVLPDETHLRKNPHRWPPLHTPITWLRNIPNRSAVLLQTLPGGLHAPKPPILSCVTGQTSYNDYNSREILHRWVDEPQRLWDVVYKTLAVGVETVIHVGPGPNLVPATFRRLSDNVKAQLASPSWGGFGLRAISRIVRRPWLTSMLSTRAALLRAPFVEQVVLEDWLLEQKVA